MKTFREKVISIIKKIPKGKTLTYKEVAARVGSPRAARAVGTICASNTLRSIPCHRVIRSDGKVGGYNGLRGPNKLKILQKEGYKV